MSDSNRKPAAKKRGLGRGLNALFSEAEAAQGPIPPAAGRDVTEPDHGVSAPVTASRTGLKTVPLEALAPGRYQPRRQFDAEALQELAASIRARGLLSPILVREADNEPGRYEIIAGERRWRASQMAQLHNVPVIIRDFSNEEALQVALVENLQRQDLNPLDEAEGLQRLVDEFGHRQEDVAQAVGKSRSHVANMLRLLNLPKEIRELVKEGKLSAGHARALIGVPDAVVLAQNVAHRGLSVRETERLAMARKLAGEGGSAKEAIGKALKEAAKGVKDADTLALEHDLSVRLGLKVSIDDNGGKGRVSVEYQSLEQLDELLRRLG
jgi:ParB family transcriptional regulator, chromosome partitioning protein